MGSLARRFGDLGLAEDAVQEAFATGLRRWPADGVPERPGAWLTTTAYRAAIGLLRRRRDDPTGSHPDPSTSEPDPADLVDGERPAGDDDLFGLVLTCCHPALALEARLALTLRHVCGLGVAQIASAFVIGEDALAKRLVRARRKIRDAGISFDPPSGRLLEERVADVRTVIYLLFSEGYLTTGETVPLRSDLCDEALWLARHLHALHPDDETAGLLALVLVHDARRCARVDHRGDLVPLAEQDRAAWDGAAIDEAKRVMETTSAQAVGRFQIEAGIALLHVVDGGPDWSRIADLYGLLQRIERSPIVETNRALAIGYADGARAGLAALAPVLTSGRLDRYAPLHAVHAELLGLAGDEAEAEQAWRRGAEVSTNAAERAAMLRRLER